VVIAVRNHIAEFQPRDDDAYKGPLHRLLRQDMLAVGPRVDQTPRFGRQETLCLDEQDASASPFWR
jgi:hypothetical protein